jgi:hypothetical protein
MANTPRRIQPANPPDEFLSPSADTVSGSSSDSGSMVTRSLKPVPSRTVICRIPKSKSLIRSRKTSINRRPAPHNRLAIRAFRPSSRTRSAFTSATVRTTGKCCGFFARVRFYSQCNSILSTSRYRNSSAERVCDCVEADTFFSVAKWDRNASTSGAAMSLGWRFPWKKMNRLIHWM